MSHLWIYRCCSYSRWSIQMPILLLQTMHASPPAFLVGSASDDARNAHKRFPLYQKFWRVLNQLGVWRHEEYLERKALRITTYDVREIMPE